MNIRLEKGKRILIIDCMNIKSIFHIGVWLIGCIRQPKTQKHIIPFNVYENDILIHSELKTIEA